jgi:hypothetical protein
MLNLLHLGESEIQVPARMLPFGTSLGIILRCMRPLF